MPAKEQSLWERLMASMNVPKRHQDPQKWAQHFVEEENRHRAKSAPFGMTGVPKFAEEMTHATFGDWDIVLEKQLASALYGPEYGRALEQAMLAEQQKYRKESPKTAFGADVAGGITQALMGGKALGAAGKIAPKVGAGVEAFAKAHPFLRTLGTGFAGGAVQGAGEAGEGNRTRGGLAGGTFGAGTGGLFHVVGSGARSALDAGAVKAGLRKASDVAKARLARAGTLSPRGATAPALYAKKAHDVTPAPVLKVMRRAVAKATGEEGITAREAERLGVPVPVQERMRRITPGNDRSVAEHQELLKAQRGTAARQQYREPYAHPVQLTEEGVQVLNSGPFRKFIQDVHNTQIFRDDPELMAEFERHEADLAAIKGYVQEKEAHEAAVAAAGDNGGWDLSAVPESAHGMAKSMIGSGAMTPTNEQNLIRMGARRVEIPEPPNPPEVSAGTLDLIRSRILRKARAMESAATPDPMYAEAYRGMANLIDRQLEESGVPGLKEARENFRAHTDRIEALGAAPEGSSYESRMGHNLLLMDPRDFKNFMKELPDAAKGDALIALRDEMTRLVQDPTKSTQALNQFLKTNVYENLKHVMGKEGANSLIEETMRAFEAGGVNTGISDKEGVALKIMNEIVHNPLNRGGIFLRKAAKVADKASTLFMTKEEAEALTRFSLNNDAHAVLGVIEKNPLGNLARAFRQGISSATASWESPTPVVNAGDIPDLGGLPNVAAPDKVVIPGLDTPSAPAPSPPPSSAAPRPSASPAPFGPGGGDIPKFSPLGASGGSSVSPAPTPSIPKFTPLGAGQ